MMADTAEKKEQPVAPVAEPVKEQKKPRKPLTESRLKQLQEARAKHSKKAAERRQQKHAESEARLVKGDGESADRFMETLKSVNPDVNIAKSESKSKKRKTTNFIDMEVETKDMFYAGVGVAAAAALAYVAGKNLNPAALRSGFTGHGSAIMGDSSTGQAAIPVQNIIPPTQLGSRPAAPSLGLYF